MKIQMANHDWGSCERCGKRTASYCAECKKWVCSRCQSTHRCDAKDMLDAAAKCIYEGLLEDDEYRKNVARAIAIWEMAERT